MQFFVVALALVRTARRSGPDDKGPACECGALSMEAQLIRQVQFSYSYNNGTSSDNSALASVLEPCYDFARVPYKVPAEAAVGVGPWDAFRVPGSDSMDPQVLLGTCKSRPKVCTVAFSGASNPTMLNSIPNWSPTYVGVEAKEDGTYALGESPKSPHGIHTGYWITYQALRAQIGDRIHDHVQGCDEIYLSGHSIGAALAGYWQWEQQQRYPFIFQVVVGANLAWFPPVPDVKCRGLQIFQEDDPVPALRQTTDAHGHYNRHAAITPAMITFRPTETLGLAGRVSAARFYLFGGELGGEPVDGDFEPWLGRCTQDGDGEPLDPRQRRGAGSGLGFALHTVSRVFGQLSSQHLIIPYVRAVEAAFPGPRQPQAPAGPREELHDSAEEGIEQVW